MNLWKMHDYVNYKPSFESDPRYILDEIIKKAKKYLPEDQIFLIEEAYNFAKQSHGDIKRLSGEYYISHPLRATEFLMEIKPDVASIQACLLHDVIEDTPVTYEDIKNVFGEEVAFLCQGLEKVSKIKYKGEDRHLETIKKTFIAMAKDLRVIFIKLADRIHNIQTLHFHPKDVKRIKIAEETMKIYVPIAKKLGLYNYQLYLENGSFKVLDEENFTKIFNYLKRNFGADSKNKDRGMEIISNVLQKEGVMDFGIDGRLKSPWRIHQKMVDKYNTNDLSTVMDLLAYRIITETVADCYIVLGIIHKYYTPLIKKIKDYIALPKFNGYRSIHTTVLGIFQFPTEIQIRTREMDEVAKYGIAAHFEYSENGGSTVAESQQGKRLKKIQTLVQNYKNLDLKEEFKNDLSIEILDQNVFLYTPQGDVIELPLGSTVLDYAFRIHTDIGLKFKNAIVNGEIKPITYRPQTGDVVEIKISKNSYTANKHWLEFLHTPSGKSQLRRFLNIQQKDDRLKTATDMLNKKLEKVGLVSIENKNNKIVQNIGKKHLERTLLDILDNKQSYGQLIKCYYPKEWEEYNCNKQTFSSKQIVKKIENQVVVDCDKHINYSLCSECCPKVGDLIIAKSGKGGIKIHSIKCKGVKTISPDKLLEAHRKNDVPKEYNMEVVLETDNHNNNIIKIMTLFSELNIKISQISIQSLPESVGVISLTISFINPTKIAFLLNNLKKYKDSIKVVKRKFIY